MELCGSSTNHCSVPYMLVQIFVYVNDKTPKKINLGSLGKIMPAPFHTKHLLKFACFESLEIQFGQNNEQ